MDKARCINKYILSQGHVVLRGEIVDFKVKDFVQIVEINHGIARFSMPIDCFHEYFEEL